MAIFVKNGLAFRDIDPIPNKEATLNEQHTILLHLTNGESLYISTFYCPKGRPSAEVLDGLLAGRKNVVLTGDFNSRHTAYGHTTNSIGGNMLHDMTLKHHMILANDDTITYTNEHHDSADKLDLMFISQPIVPMFRDFWVGEDLGSDHNTIHAHITMAAYTETNQDKSIKLYHKADWTNINATITDTMATDTLHPNTSTEQDIDSYVTKLSETITTLIEEKVPTKKLKGNSIGLPIEIRELILEKRQERRLWQHTRLPQHKTNYNRLNKQIRKLISTTRRNQWEGFCNDINLDEGQGDSWRKLRNLINPRSNFDYPTLVSTDTNGVKTHAYTTQDKLEAFADKLEQTFTKEGNVTNFDDDWRQHIDEDIHTNAPLLTPLQDQDITHITNNIDPITEQELHSKLKQLKTKKAGGHDKVTNKIISNLLPSLLPILLILYNTCLFRGYVPSAWKLALGLMILKPNKNRSDPGSYRPISLLCNLGKVLESIITSRVYAWAESTNILSHEQSGFRQNRSTNDKLYQLTQIVSHTFCRRKAQYVGTVFLDIEKAFDRVWHNGLRRKLIDMNMPAPLLRWISNFLKDRIIKASHMGKKSRDIIINHGVPQGSPLSPILFLLYISDLPPATKNVIRSLFADDLKFFSADRVPDKICKRLQSCLDDLVKFGAKWRIGLNALKTASVLFTRHGPGKAKLCLNLLDEVIETRISSKFLGITFDSHLTFRPHFQNVASIARFRLLKLFSIFNSKYGPPAHILIRLYKTYIRSLFDYGSAATCVASPSVFKIWERIQTRLIAHALHLSTNTNNTTLRRLANISTVQDRVLYQAKSWYRKSLATTAATRLFDEQHSRHYAGFDKPRPTPYCILNEISFK